MINLQAILFSVIGNFDFKWFDQLLSSLHFCTIIHELVKSFEFPVCSLGHLFRMQLNLSSTSSYSALDRMLNILKQKNSRTKRRTTILPLEPPSEEPKSVHIGPTNDLSWYHGTSSFAMPWHFGVLSQISLMYTLVNKKPCTWFNKLLNHRAWFTHWLQPRLMSWYNLLFQQYSTHVLFRPGFKPIGAPNPSTANSGNITWKWSDIIYYIHDHLSHKRLFHRTVWDPHIISSRDCQLRYREVMQLASVVVSLLLTSAMINTPPSATPNYNHPQYLMPPQNKIITCYLSRPY